MLVKKSKKVIFKNLNISEIQRIKGGSHGGSLPDPRSKENG
ncbi:hypothetical protein [Pseudoalteromonas sp. PS5]|nr:hypothetical protein [Pseudoalteromonas sp. PS5]